jgi:hypothetical protein
METIPLPNPRSDRLSSNHSALRTFGAVIAGLFIWILVATVLNLALRASLPHYHEAETVFKFTLGMKFARLVLGAMSSLSAGFVATWVGKGRMRAATLTGIVLLALFIPDHYLIWDKFPVWYHLTFLVSLLPLTVLGGALKVRDLARRSERPDTRCTVQESNLQPSD